jgi:hypothetical protein
MASTFLKPTVIARATVALLLRELALSRTIWTDAVAAAEFRGAFGDTVTLRVPAKVQARTRTLRSGAPLQVDDDLHEFGVPVTLTTDVYKGNTVTDENLALDITDFAEQVLTPQITAVAEKLEEIIAALIVGAPYIPELTIDPDDTDLKEDGKRSWWNVAVRAKRLLNEQNVPAGNRYLVVGAAVEEQILRDPRFIKADATGPVVAESALREATIGRIAGFTTLTSNFIPSDAAYAYHRSAYVLGAMPPRIPAGASTGEIRSLGQGQQAGAQSVASGIGVRWLMDYDARNTSDRSLVSTYVGTAVVEDPEDFDDPNSAKSLVRAVKIGTGS